MGLAQDVPAHQRRASATCADHTDEHCFSAAYLIVPNRLVSWRHAVAGGVAAAVGFEIMKQGLRPMSLSLPHISGGLWRIRGHPYFFNVGLSIMAHGAVGGSDRRVAFKLALWRMAARRNSSGQAVCRRATPAASACRGIFSSGKVETYSSLRERLKLSLEEMEPILELMGDADLVRQVKGGGWVLILDPAKITVADIYRLFTFRSEAARAATAATRGWSSCLTKLRLA